MLAANELHKQLFNKRSQKASIKKNIQYQGLSQQA